jgi:hypothetical protein
MPIATNDAIITIGDNGGTLMVTMATMMIHWLIGDSMAIMAQMTPLAQMMP